MSNVVPGYTFTGITDKITYQKLNLLGNPTVSIGAGEVTVSMLGPLPGTGYLIGSTPSSAAAAAIRINNTGLTLNAGVGLSIGASAGDSGIGIGQSATAFGAITWLYASTEANSSMRIFALCGSGTGAGNTGFVLSKTQILSVVNGSSSYLWASDGDFTNGNPALVATTATTGYFRIPTTNGTPTGVPINALNQIPMIYDNSANKIWFYNGSWRGVVVS